MSENQHTVPQSPEDHPNPAEDSGSGSFGSRIAGETKALVDDLREWVELRIQLVQVDIEERIEELGNRVVSMVLIAVLTTFAAAFLLHAAALGLAEWLGHPAWGYLTVGGFLAVVTWIIHIAKPRFVGKGMESNAENKEAGEALPESSSPKQIGVGTSSDDVAPSSSTPPQEGNQ